MVNRFQYIWKQEFFCYFLKINLGIIFSKFVYVETRRMTIAKWKFKEW